MIFKTIIFLTFVVYCESVYVYSSFWAPLFDPRILNYRVDVKFEPDSAKKAREVFEKNYGHRGEKLIADLGNGKGPDSTSLQEYKGYGEVKFIATYPQQVTMNYNKINI